MACPMKNQQGINEQTAALTYSSYIFSNEITNLYRSASNNTVHEEPLFVRVHQIFEVWFNTCNHELKEAIELMLEQAKEQGNPLVNQSRFTEQGVRIHEWIHRVTTIMGVATMGFSVLETMNPTDFFELRPHLQSGSGFESVQFRILESLIGVTARPENKDIQSLIAKTPAIDARDQIELLRVANGDSIATALWRWLSSFVPRINNLAEFCSEILAFHEQKGRAEGLKALLQNPALKVALVIMMYHDRHDFVVLEKIVNGVIALDEALMTWRQRHVRMVEKMIGIAIKGTGGSSGVEYLESTANREYRPFNDLHSIRSYVTSRCKVAAVPSLLQ